MTNLWLYTRACMIMANRAGYTHATSHTSPSSWLSVGDAVKLVLRRIGRFLFRSILLAIMSSREVLAHVVLHWIMNNPNVTGNMGFYTLSPKQIAPLLSIAASDASDPVGVVEALQSFPPSCRQIVAAVQRVHCSIEAYLIKSSLT